VLILIVRIWLSVLCDILPQCNIVLYVLVGSIGVPRMCLLLLLVCVVCRVADRMIFFILLLHRTCQLELNPMGVLLYFQIFRNQMFRHLCLDGSQMCMNLVDAILF
jgi:hypothetical protein